MSLQISVLPRATVVNSTDDFIVNQGSPPVTKIVAASLVKTAPVFMQVQSNGSIVVTAATNINFAGSGVSVAESPAGTALVTIPGVTSFISAREVDFAFYGGNGSNISGLGLPNPVPSSNNVQGQHAADPVNVSLFERVAYTRFTSSGTWGIAWGSNYVPFVLSRPFSWSVMFHDNAVDSSTNQYAIGMASTDLQSSTPPESINTNFFGFSFRVSPTTTVQRVLRLASVSTVVDTGVSLPTATEIWRVTISGNGTNVTFVIEKMASDYTFSTVYSSFVTIASLTNVSYRPVFSGPIAVNNLVDLYIARGTYTI